MNCPVCKQPLVILERENIEVDYCLSCHGFWLDSGELELLKEILKIYNYVMSPFKYPQVHSKEKIRKCPICFTNMKKICFNGGMIDVCSSMDGMWFDEGELSAILNNLDTKNLESSMINFLGENFCNHK